MDEDIPQGRKNISITNCLYKLKIYKVSPLSTFQVGGENHTQTRTNIKVNHQKKLC